MIAYHKQSLRNAALLKKMQQWARRGLLSAGQLAEAGVKYRTGLYSPNIFIRILLFIFSLILISSAFGMYAMVFPSIFNSSNSGVMSVSSFFFAAGCFGALELLIKEKKLYRSGIDEALLYFGLGYLLLGIGILFGNVFDGENNFLFYLIVITPFLSAAVIRYADTFITLLQIACKYAIIFLLILKLGDIAKVIMPFAFMALSATLYLFVQKLKREDKLFYWKNCLVMSECIALLVFYMAGNYFVIRESSIQYFDLHLEAGEDIPLAIFFYLFTALVPLFYVFYGLKKKDKVLLWIGLVLIASAAFTFKNYFSLGHPELILTLAGAIMILAAYFSIRYLKQDRSGITDKEDDDDDNFMRSNAEALIVAQSFSSQSSQQPQGPDMGGGDFGGAGAGGKF